MFDGFGAHKFRTNPPLKSCVVPQHFIALHPVHATLRYDPVLYIWTPQPALLVHLSTKIICTRKWIMLFLSPVRIINIFFCMLASMLCVTSCCFPPRASCSHYSTPTSPLLAAGISSPSIPLTPQAPQLNARPRTLIEFRPSDKNCQ